MRPPKALVVFDTDLADRSHAHEVVITGGAALARVARGLGHAV
jgi:hypothetical protein